MVIIFLMFFFVAVNGKKWGKIIEIGGLLNKQWFYNFLRRVCFTYMQFGPNPENLGSNPCY